MLLVFVFTGVNQPGGRVVGDDYSKERMSLGASENDLRHMKENSHAQFVLGGRGAVQVQLGSKSRDRR